MATSRHPIAPSHTDQPEQPAGHLVLYHYRNAAQGDNPENIPLPLLVGQPHGEFILPQPKRTSDLLSLTILLAILATSSATTLFAWSSTHTTPNIIPTAHASLSSTPTLPRGDAYPNPPTPAHQQLEHAPESPVLKTNPTPIAEPRRPTIQEMADALRRATAHAAPPVPNAQSPQPRHMSAQDIAILTGLAKKSLSTGDIPTARRLLQRAAEAEDPAAALLLAQTYDPAVLRSSDVRPDPERARAWYEKATQFAATKTTRPPDQTNN
jgi:TPR repeat protein